MIRNILFDFDGTLADTRQGIVLTVQETLRRMGLPAADPAAVVGTIGLPLATCFSTAATVPDTRLDEAVQLYRNIFDEVALEHISLFPKVMDTLEVLQQRGFVMAIVSSRHRYSLCPLVERLGVGNIISHVYGEDDKLRPKPAPDLALHILSDMGLEALESLVVGDTVYDLQMGAAAGCWTCGVTYGNQGRKQLSTAKPDCVIDTFDALTALL